MSAGFQSGRHQNWPSGRLSAGLRADYEAFQMKIRRKSSLEAPLPARAVLCNIGYSCRSIRCSVAILVQISNSNSNSWLQAQLEMITVVLVVGCLLLAFMVCCCSQPTRRPKPTRRPTADAEAHSRRRSPQLTRRPRPTPRCTADAATSPADATLSPPQPTPTPSVDSADTTALSRHRGPQPTPSADADTEDMPPGDADVPVIETEMLTFWKTAKAPTLHSSATCYFILKRESVQVRLGPVAALKMVQCKNCCGV